VLISSLDGRTLIRVQETHGGLAASIFGGIIGGVGGGVGFGLGGALSATLGLGAGLIALPIATVAGSYFLARSIYAAQVRRRESAAHSLADRLAETVSRYAVRAVPDAAGAAGSLPPSAVE
jgi:predicted lipid-binding transport protein (Tim44 family)